MSDTWSQAHPARRPAERPVLGRRPLTLAVGLVLIAAALTVFARFTGIGVYKLPDSPIVQSMELIMHGRPDGAVEVRNAATGNLVQTYSLKEGGGFFLTILKGMEFERNLQKIALDINYTLARHQDGRLILHDPATGRRQTVDTFGTVNTAVFANLLSKGEKQ
jgi:putative photosynthetic complex assembly protein